jgi:transposase
MGKCKRNSTAEVKQRKPLRAAKARISAPETTVRAQYRSAIGIDVHLNLLVCNFQTQLDDHREIRESREFYADRTSLDEFAQWCSEKKPEIILMESTGVLCVGGRSD